MVASVDLARGGRLASLKIHDTEILAPSPSADNYLHWGCYRISPWAGRVRSGAFAFDGRQIQLEVDLPPHAIHGLGYRTPWNAAGSGRLFCDLADRWAFGGRLDQRLVLTDSSLEMTLSVTATAGRMPAMLGWHPCFRRTLSEDGPEVVLDFEPGGTWERDVADIPTGRVVDVPDRLWEDCFLGVARAPVLTWPGQLAVRIESDAENWVVFDELPGLFCVEPLTDAPDVFNREPRVLELGDVMTLTMRLSWEQLASARTEQGQARA
ncbi:MAG: hypothetical protein O3C27_10585 [Actinomycetota bacterium]|nr:hypothetical protein [Actinomycetota bacterium]